MTAAEKPYPLSELTPQEGFSSEIHERAASIRPLKIALLGYRSHPFVGGQGIYLKYLSRALKQLGHNVEVISGPPYPELDEDIPLIKVPSLDLFSHFPNHLRALRFKHLRSFTDVFEWWTMATGGFAEPYTFGRRLNKVLQQHDYDIIHDNQSLCYALLGLQKNGSKVLSTIHHPIHQDRDIALSEKQKWGERLLVKRWYSFLSMQEKVAAKLEHIITVSNTSQKDIAAHFKRSEKSTSVIPNGIDTDIFKPLPHIQGEKFRLITTASSDQPLKGLQYLLHAIASLKDSFPEIHLQIIGKLKAGGDTEKLLNKLSLHEHVSFASGLSTEELVEYYCRANIAVCPSLYEGFGLPAGEAMACGLTVISTNGGALPEVVGDAGVIVEAGNSLALAEKIKWALTHPEETKQLGLLARQHILDNFCWKTVAKQLSHFYHSILDKP